MSGAGSSCANRSWLLFRSIYNGNVSSLEFKEPPWQRRLMFQAEAIASAVSLLLFDQRKIWPWNAICNHFLREHLSEAAVDGRAREWSWFESDRWVIGNFTRASSTKARALQLNTWNGEFLLVNGQPGRSLPKSITSHETLERFLALHFPRSTSPQVVVVARSTPSVGCVMSFTNQLTGKVGHPQLCQNAQMVFGRSHELVWPWVIARLFVFPVKAAMMSPFWGAVSHGKLLIPYRNVASDFSFEIFAIADRIFNS